MLDSTTHYENFPVGSWLVPRKLRPAYAAIYRFARHADDLADEGMASDQQRLDALQHLKLALHGQADHPLVSDVLRVSRQFDLNIACFHRLLNAFSQDVVQKRYATMSDLEAYCDNSANPVGELILALFSAHRQALPLHPAALQRSNQICSALQLINFLQDMSIDWKMNRIYLPLSLAVQCGLTQATLEATLRQSLAEAKIPATREGDSLLSAIRSMHRHTQKLLDEGRPLISMVPTRLSLELRAICAGGQTILDKLEHAAFDPFRQRPKLGLADLPHLIRLFFARSH